MKILYCTLNNLDCDKCDIKDKKNKKNCELYANALQLRERIHEKTGGIKVPEPFIYTTFQR
jgi:hypothetical protein